MIWQSRSFFPVSQIRFNFWCSRYWVLGNNWNKRKRGNRIICSTFRRWDKCGSAGEKLRNSVAGMILSCVWWENTHLEGDANWNPVWWTWLYRCQQYLKASFGHLNNSDHKKSLNCKLILLKKNSIFNLYIKPGIWEAQNEFLPVAS